MEQWKLRRNNAEMPIGGTGELQQLVRDGKVLESDYVWNPILEKWLYARDVAEVAQLFRQVPTASAALPHAPSPPTASAPSPQATKSNQGCAAGIALALLGFAALFWGIPIIGGLLIVAGIVVGVVSAAQK